MGSEVGRNLSGSGSDHAQLRLFLSTAGSDPAQLGVFLSRAGRRHAQVGVFLSGFHPKPAQLGDFLSRVGGRPAQVGDFLSRAGGPPAQVGFFLSSRASRLSAQAPPPFSASQHSQYGPPDARRHQKPSRTPAHQNSALPTVRGCGSTSRMLETPVRYITRRSKPRPKPA